MAVYKVIQDVESEDKLLGPLTFKGFVYILIAGALAFINFRLLVASNLGIFRWIMIIILAMPMLLFALLASPLGREQPTEVWLLSRIRFFLQPRLRIWNQSGLSHMVTVTAPEKAELHLTKDLSQKEVKSRLRALAATMDTRGWAVKHVTATDVKPADDIMDEQNNPTAQKFDELIEQKDKQRKQAITSRIKTAREDGEALQSGTLPAKHQDQTTHTGHSHKKPATHAGHTAPAKTDDKQVTPPDQTAKLELAQSGNDLSVESVAKLANRPPRVEQIGPGEVVINLH